MNAGRLRHRGRFEHPTETNVGGELVTTWTPTTPVVWCEVRSLRGRELYAARQLYAEASHRVILRRVDGITPKHRFVLVSPRAGTFNILDSPDVPQVGSIGETSVVCAEQR